MARQRGNRWQADVVIDGARKRLSFATQEEAENYERLIAQGYSPSLQHTLKAFADEQHARVWGENKTAEKVFGDLRVIYRYIPASTSLVSITDLAVDDMITRMKNDGLANGTINRKLAVLSKLLRRAKKLGLLSALPEIERQREGKGRDRVWSKEDERKALEFLEHHGMLSTAALVRFLLYTGCRVGEAYDLDRADVSGKTITFRETKNGTTRVIPMVPNAELGWKYICRTSNAAKPFSVVPRDTFRGHWERLRVHFGAAEDRSFVPHMLRHTCATRLVQAGVDLPRVMKWMGHKSVQVTMRYSHLAPKDLDLAAAALS